MLLGSVGKKQAAASGDFEGAGCVLVGTDLTHKNLGRFWSLKVPARSHQHKPLHPGKRETKGRHSENGTDPSLQVVGE